MYKQDYILYFLTARRRVRVPVLREFVFRLSPDAVANAEVDGLRTYKLCRLLDMLGHSEFHRGRPGCLSLVSAHFAKLPSLGKERYLVVGARTSSTVAEICNEAKAAHIHITISESNSCAYEPLSPHRIILEFESPGNADKLASRLGIGITTTPSSWSLACFSQSLTEFEVGLEWHPRNISLSSVQIYDPSRLSFLNGETPTDTSYLCRPTVDHSVLVAVKADQEARVADHDWGRHWALSKAGIAGIQHDVRKRLLAVPVVAPLPRLLARALCLCSGDAPSIIREERNRGFRDFNVFSDVPLELANKIAEKLEISFLPKAINTPNLQKP